MLSMDTENSEFGEEIKNRLDKAKKEFKSCSYSGISI